MLQGFIRILKQANGGWNKNQIREQSWGWNEFHTQVPKYLDIIEILTGEAG